MSKRPSLLRSWSPLGITEGRCGASPVGSCGFRNFRNRHRVGDRVASLQRVGAGEQAALLRLLFVLVAHGAVQSLPTSVRITYWRGSVSSAIRGTKPAARSSFATTSGASRAAFGGTDRAVEREVHDREHAARSERGAQLRRVGRAVRDVVPDVDDEDPIDRPRREPRIIVRDLFRGDVAKPFARGAFRQVIDHRGFGIDGQHASGLADRTRQIRHEVAGTCTDISDTCPGFDREQADHLVGLLPRGAIRGVELPGPPGGVAEVVVMPVLMGVRRGRRSTTAADPERHERTSNHAPL